MTIALPETPKIQVSQLGIAGLIASATFVHIFLKSSSNGLLFLIGLFAGIALYHAAFGFTGAYRNAIVRKDMSGVVAQVVMLVIAMILFAPVLSEGEVFGHKAGGFVAPVSVAMLFGAFVFGMGMQLGGGCASGTLFTAGGGNLRMFITLIFFCLGGWWATLDMAWWRDLPSFGAVSFGARLGYGPAVMLQILVLAAMVLAFWRLGLRLKQPLLPNREKHRGWLQMLGQGPWPLVFGAVALALVNWSILLVTGHPWGVTWGFTLWAAKAMASIGWDPAMSAYWAEGWRQNALNAPFFAEHTTITNIGIIIGAAAAASLGGKMKRPDPIPPLSLLAAILGGLMMGYGARLAYGCNIGAFFSGVASTSLHGWAWIIMALAGTWAGIRLRPLFKLAN